MTGQILATALVHESELARNEPTHRSITYQERTTMAYRARPSG